MHVNYYCDTCGKAYPNEKEAMECEKKHAEEARVAKELEEAKTQARKDIEKNTKKSTVPVVPLASALMNARLLMQLALEISWKPLSNCFHEQLLRSCQKS